MIYYIVCDKFINTTIYLSLMIDQIYNLSIIKIIFLIGYNSSP